ncbi:MAG: YcaQ family DNA glycosylase [Bacteroidetes bacterium]|nr:YcaQ family DNA glycosylase [Bacteroidota bacterium]
MKPITLTESQARKIIIHAAGLAKRAQFGKGPEAVFKLIDHLGFIQIDTNYVVERAHHHAIASRVPDYDPDWLDQLQTDDRIFEYLTYASGYMPMHDYRFTLPIKESFLTQRSDLPQQELNIMNRVLDRVMRDGPQMARDFENDRVEASTGWWDWRPSKLALERLYFDGRLMTTHRKDFQKIFDLPVNCIPSDTDTTIPSDEEFARHNIRRTLQAHGIAYEKEISWRTRFLKTQIKSQLTQLISEGEVCEVSIEGKKTAPLYMLSSYKNKKINLSGDAFILSPFDTINVFRHRLRDFFDFDYQVECFVPAPKRKYGYFSLPILIGDTFVARMDAKADRKQRILNVLNLHFESPKKFPKSDAPKLRDTLAAFAKFNRCTDITIKKTNNKTLSRTLIN